MFLEKLPAVLHPLWIVGSFIGFVAAGAILGEVNVVRSALTAILAYVLLWACYILYKGVMHFRD